MRKLIASLFISALVATSCSGGNLADMASPIGTREPSGVGAFQLTVPGECGQIYAEALGSGIGLPEGWRMICPGQALDERGRPHWGMTCFGGVGPEGQCPYISINTSRIGANLVKRRYVIFHELCHANGNTSEHAADACAAAIGASLKYSPY